MVQSLLACSPAVGVGSSPGFLPQFTDTRARLAGASRNGCCSPAMNWCLVQIETPPSPHDSCDWLQRRYNPECRISGGGVMNGCMFACHVSPVVLLLEAFLFLCGWLVRFLWALFVGRAGRLSAEKRTQMLCFSKALFHICILPTSVCDFTRL